MGRSSDARARRVSFALAAGLLLLLSLGSSGVPAKDHAAIADHQPLPASSVRLIGDRQGAPLLRPVWLVSRMAIAAVRQPSPNSASLRVVLVRPDTGAQRLVPLLSEPGCTTSATDDPAPLADGRLAFLQTCYGDLTRPGDQMVTPAAYNLRTGKVSRLFGFRLGAFVGQMAFPRAGGVGLLNDGYGLGEHLAWLSRTGPNLWRLPFARLGNPAWSPESQRVAVSAVAPTNRQGVDRIDLPWQLIIVRVQPRRITTLLTGMASLNRPAWSPDGKWIAFSGIDSSHTEGIWVINVATHRRVLLQHGTQLGDIAWLQSRNEIAVATGVGARSFIEQIRSKARATGLLVIRLPAWL
jgi:dipeptidyl aminopeptidase/acylaminoacyl peptidase